MAYSKQQESKLLQLLNKQEETAPDFSSAQLIEEEPDFSSAQPVEQPTNRLSQIAKSLGDFPGMPLMTPYRDIPGVAASAVNTYAGGIPKWAYESMSHSQYPEPSTTQGKVLGTTIGATAGLPMLAAKGAAAQMASRFPQIAPWIARAAEGAAGGLGFDIPAAFNNPKQAAGNMAIGAAGNVAIPPMINAVSDIAGDIYRVTNTPLRARFVNSIRSAFLQSKKLAGETFGNKIDVLSQKFPDKTIDVSGIVGEVQQRSLNNPAFKAIVMRAVQNDQESALMQSIINQPETATNLTLKEAQEVKKVFGRVIKQKFNQISPEYTDAHLDALDIWHEIRAAQLEVFPEFADIAAGYRKSITDFRTVKPYLTKSSLEPNLMNNFSNKSEIKQAVHDLLPKETVKEIERFVRANLIMQGAGKLAFAGTVGAVGTAAAGAVAKPIIDSIRNGYNQ